MSKKDIIIITVVLILAIGVVALFLFLAQKQEEIGLANIATNTNRQSNINESTNANTEVNDNVNVINADSQTEPITFENFFKVVYLAKFTGQSSPPVATEFSTNDKIVMSVRTIEGSKTEEKMYPKIYKGDKLISDAVPIEILSGEVGLENPGKKGDYELKLFVDNTLVKTLTFSIK